ncbi:MAG: GntR family transcriptional regulator YhfZ [Bacillota bacterium]
MLHRYGLVAVQLATRLLAAKPGDRIDSIGQLASDFRSGRGTVQAALRLLVQEGAVELETRGSLGSYIRSLDHNRLLTVSGLSPIIGVMAVAYSPRFQGLAAGLTRAFERAGLPLVLAHLRGGRNRLHFLRTGRCDFAVISRLAWQEETAAGDLDLQLSFGPGSNVGDHMLVLASPQTRGIVDGMRVGVDPSSSDHTRLTLEECRGKSVQLVEISYAQALPRLQAGEIDAAVWDAGVPLPASLGLTIVPRERRDPVGAPDTEAVLVTRSQAGPLGDLIRRRVDPAWVTEVQQRVLSGEELPVF